jgi:hypothetical protein
VAIPILDPGADAWTPLLTTLKTGYDACFGKVHSDAVDEYGHVKTGAGTQMSGARRWDQPSQPLVECVIRYYTENDVPGPDGRPVRIALNGSTAAELTAQVTAEREALLDKLVGEEQAREDDETATAEEAAAAAAAAAANPSAPGGSGGAAGPGAPGSDGDFPVDPGVDNGSGGPLPPATGGAEQTPELPGGVKSPVAITDLDSLNDPRPKDTLLWNDLGHELQILGSNVNADASKMQIRIADGQGDSLEAENLSIVDVSGQAGLRFTLPDQLVGGIGFKLTMINTEAVAGNDGPVISEPVLLNVHPSVTELYSDSVSGSFGERGGKNQLVSGKPFVVTGQGFPPAPDQIYLEVNGAKVDVTSVSSDPDGDEDQFQALAPTDGTLGAEVEIKFTVRKDSEQQFVVVVDPNPVFQDPNQPTSDPLLTKIEDGAGAELTALIFSDSGEVTFTLVGQNLSETASELLWNGAKLPATHVNLDSAVASTTETGTIRLTYTVHGNQTSDPLITAGTISLTVETTTDKGTFTSSALSVDLLPRIAASSFSSGLTEGETFTMVGYGFGATTSGVSLSFDGAAAQATGSAVQQAGGGQLSIEYTVPDVGSVAAGETKTVVGTIGVGGKTWSFGDSSQFLNIPASLAIPGAVQVTAPPPPEPDPPADP